MSISIQPRFGMLQHSRKNSLSDAAKALLNQSYTYDQLRPRDMSQPDADSVTLDILKQVGHADSSLEGVTRHVNRLKPQLGITNPFQQGADSESHTNELMKKAILLFRADKSKLDAQKSQSVIARIKSKDKALQTISDNTIYSWLTASQGIRKSENTTISEIHGFFYQQISTNTKQTRQEIEDRTKAIAIINDKSIPTHQDFMRIIREGFAEDSKKIRTKEDLAAQLKEKAILEQRYPGLKLSTPVTSTSGANESTN